MPDEKFSSQWIDLTAADGHQLRAYSASPEKAAAAIIVVQEIFGVNSHIRSIVEDFASEGFLAIAPSLFDRKQRGVELGYVDADVQKGVELSRGLGLENPLKDIEAAMEYAGQKLQPTAVGVVGYCWGASLAWLAACRLAPAAAVGYYGGQIAKYAQELPRCSVMLHYGEKDAHIGPADIEEVRSRHPEVAVYTYADAGHGFNCDQRKDYNQEAATLARARTLEFFRKKLLTH